MFDPFFTTKGGQSTGLGLATVRRVVERAGGWIDVRSTLGAGTTLLVTLPQMGGQAIA
jgi:signal transduction histidine kinase